MRIWQYYVEYMRTATMGMVLAVLWIIVKYRSAHVIVPLIVIALAWLLASLPLSLFKGERARRLFPAFLKIFFLKFMLGERRGKKASKKAKKGEDG